MRNNLETSLRYRVRLRTMLFFRNSHWMSLISKFKFANLHISEVVVVE